MDIQLQVDQNKQENQIHPDTFHGQMVDISFKNLTYKVSVPNTKPDGPKLVERTVLNDITGVCPGGQVTAILGASGAGKTSLLNILAKRICSGGNVLLTGDLFANQKPYSPEKFASFASYVMQNDILFETLTPREAFQFVANLKYRDEATKTKRVDESIRTLKLQRCQHSLIGGTYNKGISGGERKRTSIGYELVSDPKCIMLDEPTSGLDSFTAFSIINLLRTICKKLNKTIIFTIHQPSADIYELFDRVMLLVDGRFIYQGPKTNIVSYFNDIGFKCPQYSNPMDYLISIMHAESAVNVKNYPTYFQNYEQKLAPQILQEHHACNTNQIVTKHVETSFGYQFMEICRRGFINVKRDKMLVRGRAMQAIFMGLIAGGIYFGVGSNTGSFNSIMSTEGVLFFLSINHFMSSLGPVLIQFPAERAVFLREENSKLYTSWAYFLGKSTVEIPFLIIIPIIQQLIAYWMIKLNDNEASIVVTHFLIYCLLSLAGNSIGLMGGCMFKDVKVASGVLPMLVMPMVLFSGFFQNIGNMMKWISWFQYISPIKYAFEAQIRNNFIGVDFPKGIVDPVTALALNIGLWESVFALIGFIFAYRIIAFLFLVMLKSKIQ